MLMTMFSIGSLDRPFYFMCMFFVGLNRFDVSGRARLFIPDLCCHRFNTSVIASHRRSTMGYNRRTISSGISFCFSNIFHLSTVDESHHG